MQDPPARADATSAACPACSREPLDLDRHTGRRYTYAAGVIPYTFYNSNVYFLLGKASHSGRLTTFCGKNAPDDATVEDTAAREFYEETLGAVVDQATMRSLLSRATTRLESQTPRGLPCYTYLAQIPYRKLYVQCFAKTRAFLDSIRHDRAEHCEMADIKWVCGRSMLSKIRRQWEQCGHLTSTDEWDRIAALCSHGDGDPMPATPPEGWSGGRASSTGARAADEPRPVVTGDVAALETFMSS